MLKAIKRGLWWKKNLLWHSLMTIMKCKQAGVYLGGNKELLSTSSSVLWAKSTTKDGNVFKISTRPQYSKVKTGYITVLFHTQEFEKKKRYQRNLYTQA